MWEHCVPGHSVPPAVSPHAVSPHAGQGSRASFWPHRAALSDTFSLPSHRTLTTPFPVLEDSGYFFLSLHFYLALLPRRVYGSSVFCPRWSCKVSEVTMSN